MIEFTKWVSAQTGGLRLVPNDKRAAIIAALACILSVTLWAVLLNVLIFRDALPTGYSETYTSPLWPRTLLVCVQALSEELLYRMVLMSGLAVIGFRLFGRTPAIWVIGSIVLAQLACVWPFVLAFPLYASLDFWLIGCVWGWLYWRHGWVTAALAHCLIHLLLDPILYWLL